nr:F237 [uncultured bacterium]
MPKLYPFLTRLTASALNSAVYVGFGIFISCLPKVTLTLV